MSNNFTRTNGKADSNKVTHVKMVSGVPLQFRVASNVLRRYQYWLKSAARKSLPFENLAFSRDTDTFTSGEGWKYDYGTSAQSEEMFRYLLGYSPVHYVREGVHYPATLVTTADHDDRVVPAHSYKFIAQLQQKQAGENPVLIRIDVNAGHGAGMPMSKMIDLSADLYAFTLFNMGIRELSPA